MALHNPTGALRMERPPLLEERPPLLETTIAKGVEHANAQNGEPTDPPLVLAEPIGPPFVLAAGSFPPCARTCEQTWPGARRELR